MHTRFESLLETPEVISPLTQLASPGELVGVQRQRLCQCQRPGQGVEAVHRVEALTSQ